MKATTEDIKKVYRNDYEVSILEAMAKTFNFEIRTGKSLYAVCCDCGKRLSKNAYGMGSLSERISTHICRRK